MRPGAQETLALPVPGGGNLICNVMALAPRTVGFMEAFPSIAEEDLRVR